MSGSWGHTVRRASHGERFEDAADPCRACGGDGKGYGGRPCWRCKGHGRYPQETRECAGGGKLKGSPPVPARVHRWRADKTCGQPVEYVATYKYVSGRAGNVSTRDTPLCTGHATRFASKHGLDLPSLDVVQEEPPPSALEQALGAIDQLAHEAQPLRCTRDNPCERPSGEHLLLWGECFTVNGRATRHA